MADLPRDFLLAQLIGGDGPARGFQCMDRDLAQDPVADLFISGQRSPMMPETFTYRLQSIHTAVAGQPFIRAEVFEELFSAFLPRPFLDLKAQAVHLFVKQPLRIDVTTQDPALIGGIK